MHPSALKPPPGAGRNPNALRLSVGLNATEQRVGVANKGFCGISIRPSTRYQVSFFAKADAALGGRLTVGRESTSGTGCATATVSGIGASWAKYTTTLTTGTNAPVLTANRFVVYADGRATGRRLWFTLPSAPSSRRLTQTTPTGDRLGTGVRRQALGTRRLSRGHPCGQHPASMRSASRVRCGSRRPTPAWHLSTERTRAPPPDGGPAVAGRATGSLQAQAGSHQERLPVPRVWPRVP